MSTKEEIKKWLKDNGKDRHWLAEKCEVEKRTVDNWLSPARVIPSKGILAIREILNPKNNEEDERKIVNFPSLNGVVAVAIPFSEDDIEAISKAAKADGMTLEEYIRNAAIRDIDEDDSFTVKTAEDPGAYDGE